MAEVEDEVDYYRSLQDPPKPRYVVPFDEISEGNFNSEYLTRRTLVPEEVKKNKVKLDSIILKGSILLSRQSESDYVDDAVFFISKAYFYMREWYQSEQKAKELIENFPESKWQPDAHLFLAMDMLQQGQIEEAEEMLSKTVDVAFKFKRQDILSEAFRLNADAQLALGVTDQAIKPYKRAILLSDDNEEQARWQYEIGVVYFRAGQFDEAVLAFDKVAEYDPDDLTAFEAGLQRAVALRTAERFDEAEYQLDALAEEEDFKQWEGIAFAERVSLQNDRSGAGTFSPEDLAAIDSVGGKEYAVFGVYERGVRAFRGGDYQTALANFSFVQSSKAPFQQKARRYTIWINYYNEQYFHATQAIRFNLDPFPDSLASKAAEAYYNVARFFVHYSVEDSTEFYYREALKWAPEGSKEGAKSLYALSEFLRLKGNGVEADSLMDILATRYGKSEYAQKARQMLGYSEQFVIDPVEELYMSGRSFMQKSHNYVGALAKFDSLTRTYPWSEYAPQAMYASGLIYEKYLNNPDSALYYYSRLIDRYPESEQAKSIRELVTATRDGKDGVVAAGEPELEPLAEGEKGDNIIDPTIDPRENKEETENKPLWFESSLFDPVPELAMERRGKRTLDIQ